MPVTDIAALRRDFLMGPVAAVRRLGPGAAPAAAPEPPEPCVIAIGAFDGFHRGHRELIERTVADARRRGTAAVAVTFDPDPDCVVAPAPAPKLTDLAGRVAAIAAAGADEVAVVAFDRSVAALDCAGFFERVLAPALDVRAVHVGADFRLGAGAASSVEGVRAWAAPRGIEVTGHELIRDGGEPITATRIRGLVAVGEMGAAARELGRRYSVRGTVRRGRGQGAGMGFPTANVAVDAAIARPASGVYAGWARVGSSAWPAAVNVGVPPTFRDAPGAAEIEANLLGFSGDLYGAEVQLSFDRLLRPQRAFASLDELIATVRGNIEDVRRLFGDAEAVLEP